MSTMKFCRECNNILYPREDRDEKILMYACRNCDHQEAADNNCVYRNEVHHSVAERTQVLQDVATDPTLPRTKAVTCTVCNHPEAVFFQANMQAKNQTKVMPYRVSPLLMSTFSSRIQSGLIFRGFCVKGCYGILATEEDEYALSNTMPHLTCKISWKDVVAVIFEKKHVGDGFGIAYGCINEKESALSLTNRSTILINLT
ncbi:DNA-DIRECTED RNA polymerase SUBUNIT [Salix koriyanagi]|uniref:DNA-DIRECTED RNA polymerase SUBUNIT n=1 Tax=Salix koriyanagi TaxID=2511006 RepID=A0A9Q0WS83_9ROSI|nr:DNA-DIRECTED RNA polymerase SUBUNIT [Salix koriyanagi]